jgi:hypothetical protein
MSKTVKISLLSSLGISENNLSLAFLVPVPESTRRAKGRLAPRNAFPFPAC